MAWAAPGGSAAAGAGPVRQGADRYCAILVGKAASRDDVSPVIARACSATSSSDARVKMTGAAEQARVANAIPRDLLMTWFEDVFYGGSSTNVYGSDGPCDGAGYRLDPGDWGDKISSAAGTDACNVGEFTSHDKSRVWRGLLPTPGLPGVNDDVGIVRTWHE